MPQPKAGADPQESKADRFKRVAGKRVNDLLDGLRRVERMAQATSQYEYTPEQAEKIVAALRAEVDAVEKAFAGQPTQGQLEL